MSNHRGARNTNHSSVMRLTLLSGLVAVLWGLLSALCPGGAAARKPRCRLERVDFDPRTPGEVRVVANVVELEGLPADQPAKAFRLAVNGRPVGPADKVVPFERSGGEAYIVLAVEIAALYAPAIDKVKEAVQAFLEALPPRGVKVKLILFGSDLDPQPRFLAPAALSQNIDDIDPDDEGEVAMGQAVEAGLVALKNLKLPQQPDGKEVPPPRKLMVVLSDGLNSVMTRKYFSGLGDRLHQSGISLFPVAFSPRDDRGPLLNLGELAKRSAGTFRWAEKEDNLKEQFLNLAEELKRAEVLTFTGKQIKKLDDTALLSASYVVACGELVSNPFSSGGAPPPPAGWPWWIKWPLIALGALLGLWGLAQAAVFWLNRRHPQQQHLPGQPPGTGAYGSPGAQPGTGGHGSPGAQAGTGAYPNVQPGTGAYPAAQQRQGMPLPSQGLPVVQPALPTGGFASVGAGVVLQAGRQAAAAAGPATLILIGGALGGQRLTIQPGSTLVIGKSVDGPGSLRITDDLTVSSRHCELRRDGAGWVFTDLGSTNGSFVNDRRVSAPVFLQDGDLCRIGTGTQFKFRVD